MVCKNGEENRSFSNGRVIKDEVIKMKSQIYPANAIKPKALMIDHNN
jgi:hypothetical protein